jgi:large subunit ribosomal protein L5
MSRLKEKYDKEVRPQMMGELGYSNVMMVPMLKKVVLNIGLGEAIANAKAIDAASADMVAICGQHPVVTKSKKSIAVFKLRKGNSVGMMVTLRGPKMYDFMDKFMNIVLPRIRDFQGVGRGSFDGRGNYSIGLRDQISFPEIEYDKVDKMRGLEITVVTNAKSDDEARRLLEILGMPFERA